MKILPPIFKLLKTKLVLIVYNDSVRARGRTQFTFTRREKSLVFVLGNNGSVFSEKCRTHKWNVQANAEVLCLKINSIH